MKIKKILVIILSVMIIGMAVMEIILPKREYSENENRHLATFPEMSFNSLKTGELVENIEAYVTDHFPLRDEFMSLYAITQRCEGMKEINNVFVGKNGYLIEKQDEYKNLEKIYTKINTLYEKVKDKGVSVNVMLVPTCITFYSKYLPDNAVYASQTDAKDKIKSKLADGINYIEPFDMDANGNFSSKYDDYQMFYKTDHHWTCYGAYFAYENYCLSMGLKPFSMSDYSIKTVSESFYGTVFSKVNDLSVEGDIMVLFDKERNLTVNYQGGQSDSLYNDAYLNKKDKYSYYLNNINDRIDIVNNDIHNGKVLLVVKDSYANCFIPFLTDYYEKIIVLDTRYYMYGASPIADKENVTDILILYNMSTIDSDAGINGIY